MSRLYKIKMNKRKIVLIVCGVLTVGVVTMVSSFYNVRLVVNKKGFNSEPVQFSAEDIMVDLDNLSDKEKASVKAFLQFKNLKMSLIPSGVPKVYGQELSLNFDEVQESMNKMRALGPTYGQAGKKIKLSGSELGRYTEIALQTSCEYCCSAQALVRENGEAACGCAHSVMMRALIAYLVRDHAEMSNEEILAQANAWKRTFFPKQTIGKSLKGSEEFNLVIEEFPGLLPDMVGGC